LEGSLEEIQNSGIKDQWFLDNLVEEKKKCYAVSFYKMLY
jgi:hypothetical protein